MPRNQTYSCLTILGTRMRGVNDPCPRIRRTRGQVSAGLLVKPRPVRHKYLFDLRTDRGATVRAWCYAGSPLRVKPDSRLTARTRAATVTMAPMTTEVATDRPAFREPSWAIPLAMPSP